MEGPTPVSALIHAATMVTAGVFLVARAHAFFEASGDAMTSSRGSAASPRSSPATVALVQPDIKRVLAYSTISQLGYMFLALGIGAYGAAIFQVVTHAFFKGSLFLGAGSVIHGNADNQDMRIMGRFRKYMPYTSFAFIVAWLAIAGVPPFAGFWSKDEILTKAFFDHDYGVCALGLVAALLTGFYMTREVYLVFFGNARFRPTAPSGRRRCRWCRAARTTSSSTTRIRTPATSTPTTSTFERASRRSRSASHRERSELGDHLPHESPPTMTIPLLVLSSLPVIGGILSIPIRSIEFLTEWLEPVFHDVPESSRRRPSAKARSSPRSP